MYTRSYEIRFPRLQRRSVEIGVSGRHRSARAHAGSTSTNPLPFLAATALVATITLLTAALATRTTLRHDIA